MQKTNRSLSTLFKTKKSRILGVIGGLLVAAGLLIFIQQCTAGVDRVVLATGVPGGGYARLGKQLQEALRGTLDIELLHTSGSLENIRLLNEGKVSFAFIQGGPNMGQYDLVALANLQKEYGHLLVRADSPITSSSNLGGKTIAMGQPLSGSSSLGTDLIDMGRVDPKPIISHGAFLLEDIEHAFSSGEIDAAFMVFELHAPLMEDLLGTGRYRLIPLHDVQAAVRLLPGTFPAVIPHNFYGPNRSIPPQSEEEFETIAVNALMACRPEVAPKHVLDILRTIYSVPFRRDALLQELTETGGRRVQDLALHAAAEKYYERKDPVTSDKFEIASFFLAGLICLVSSIHFTINWRQRRRNGRCRKRIETYFEELLKYGTFVERSNDIGELNETLSAMMATQRRAEKEWLQKKLLTEDMENLYVLYGIRSRNAFNKIFQLQNSERSAARGEEPVSKSSTGEHIQ